MICISYYSDGTWSDATWRVQPAVHKSWLRSLFSRGVLLVKRESFLFSAIALAIVLSTSGLVFSQRTQGRSGGVERPAPSTTTSRRSTRARGLSEPALTVEQSFGEALRLIQENYVDGRKLDHNSVVKSSIIGMLRALDPHSNYYDRKEYEELRTDQRSEYFGIGATINPFTIAGNIDTYILATFRNSPAARAGLRYGDRIVAVNGESMRGKPSIDVRDRIRGPRGSVARITIERAATGQIETVEITRDAVSQPSIPDAYLIRPGVGYIDMTQGFNYMTSDELEDALERLRAQGMSSLVLDLRGNPGGFLDQAIKVADMFLQSGQLILTQKGRDARSERRYHSENARPDTTPIVILVNGFTASASEIVAGAVQDHDRGLIVGETSFGKGLVQGIFPLEFGAGLTLTTAKYYTPSGRLIQRDYSNGGFYDYYTRGGSIGAENDGQQGPTGPESRTDIGRAVYGGGGITPDEIVKPRNVSQFQSRFLSPLFAFTRELANGRIQGLDSYRVQRPIDFDRRLQPSDFPVSDAVLDAFKDYLAKHEEWKPLVGQVDRNREFIQTQVRFNLVTAAFGRIAADQVTIATDPQVARAIDLVPRARALAMSAMQARPQP